MVQQSEIMNIADEIDATGLLCPLPVLKLRKRIKGINKGQVIKIFTDDPAAELDIPHFCNETGHTLISQKATGSCATEYQVRKEI